MLAAPTRQILSQLQPSERRIALAKERALGLLQHLDERSDILSIRQLHLFGSISRGTVLRDFKDIDYLVELEPGSLTRKDGERLSPAYALRRLSDALAHCRAGLAAQGVVEAQSRNHCAAFRYPASDLRIDVVPAFRLRGKGRFEIPSRVYGEWIETRPFRMRERLSDAPPKIHDAIRLLKAWRRARGGRRKGVHLPSFAIATYLLSLPRPSPSTPPLQLVYDFFDRVADADARSALTLGGNDTGAEMVLISPSTGRNILRRGPKTDRSVARERKSRLIRLCRDARETLDAINMDAPWQSESSTVSSLRSMFIGRD